MTLPSRRKVSQLPFPSLIRRFLFFFFPLALVLAVVSYLFYSAELRGRTYTLQSQQKYMVQQQQAALRNQLRSIASDALVLATHHEIHTIMTGQAILPEEERQALAVEFFAFARFKKIYDRVRFLDHTGMEVVSILYRNGRPEIVPRDGLQSQEKQDYFQKTFTLNRGEVFVSPFDLSVENNAVELPVKPMIRFGSPVFGPEKNKIGVLLLDYLGEELLNELVTLAENSPGRTMLLNRDGYWLLNPEHGEEWGFRFAERKHFTFGNRFPRAWQMISSTDSGCLASDEGMFTFVTLRPLLEGLHSSNGSPGVIAESAASLEAEAHFWKLISFIPAETVKKNLHPFLFQYLLGNVFLFLCAGAGCWLAAFAGVKRQQAEAKLKELATHDTLTGLPNRHLLFDRLAQALARARRSRKMAAILFLDLDRFKEVNDELGHEAGDAVLYETARRMKNQVREEDTVARMGGDEFIIILHDLPGGEQAGKIAGKLIDVVNQPIQLEHGFRTVGVSVGISMFPKDGDEPNALISRADTAMYAAKNGGRNCSRFAKG
jgi:diguanylate cyclase (GGDEF)-like protein